MSTTDQIETVADLRALPERAVILDHDNTAYQQEQGDWGSGDRWWSPEQIALPALVLWLPRIVVPHEHEWVSERQLTDATETAVCAGCGARREEVSA